MGRKIAYIMSRFPHLPETFILREMIELERQGWEISLYPLISQQSPVVHQEAQPWMQRAHHLPFFSPALLAANIKMIFKCPRLYGWLWARTLWDNKTDLNFLIRAVALLPQAVYAAGLMQQEGITHIHAHYATHPALVAWVIHKLTDISYSITVHAHDIFVRKAMLATKLGNAAFIAAISEFNREYLAQEVGPWVKEKTRIVHCGIVPDNYAQASNAVNRNGAFKIITIGSLQPYKGQSHLIQACALLRERGIPVHCRIIGEGEERPNLERMIREAGLDEVVELLGAQPQEEVARLLPTAQCYVQPSIITPAGKMEGIPVSLMEALACGLPVVATELSGIPELVRPGKTGYLVPPVQATALADALATVYENPAQAERLAKAGQKLVRQEFELHANVQRLAMLFEQAHANSNYQTLPRRRIA